ncbi:MAG TPA: tRNA pseudouridine(38-40) synthase TruA [Planctomycetota bacterium]
MRNVRVLLAYDGSAFFGWQRQEGFASVQQGLEEALLALTGEQLRVLGAGRTDTGVHALGQVASFHTDTRLPDERLLFALNAHLPRGLVARALETCPDAFHAQKDARGKRYAYLVRTETFPLPIGRGLWHWVPEALDLAAMRQAARAFVGRHDFTSLATQGSPRRSNVRRIRGLHLVARRSGFALVVEGDGFLYNMVRTLAGTLLEVGRGKRSAQSVPDLLAARDRRLAGPTAPPEGLYLVRVLYAEPTFRERPAGPRGRPGVFSG